MLFSPMNPVGTRKFHQTVTIVLCAIFMAFSAMATPGGLPISPLTIEKAHFTVEEARTPAQQEQGLMFRPTLAADRGMLFIFPSPQIASMWMKNTQIPLDILFIDAKGTIVHIAENTVPGSEHIITSSFRVKAVLELAAGTCKKQGIHSGASVIHAIFTDNPRP